MDDNVNKTQKVVDVQNNTITYIQPTIIDTTDFSLNLFGHKTTDIAYALNENFIRLTQNFYGDIQPIKPLNGQLWFNATDNMLYRWLKDNWVQIEKDNTYDSFMYIMYDVDSVTEFVLDEFVFNFTINNIKLYNQSMQDVKFIIDPFDSRKIILKESNVSTLYIVIFHPKDKITNPLINRKKDVFTSSGQTQFDIDSFLDGSNINTLSVSLNDILLKNNEFSIKNNILTINGMIYRVKTNDKLTIWLYGGSLSSYYSTLYIHTNKNSDFLNIPKIFKEIVSIDIFDLDEKTLINPILVTEFDDYINFEFLDKKNIKVKSMIRII